MSSDVAALESAEPDATVAPRGPERLFVPWVALTVASVCWMWVSGGDEVIPFHVIWIGFALAYGFEPWPVRRTAVAVAAAGAFSGAVLIDRAAAGDISWEETFEIPLMVSLAALIVWHVQRRESALRTVRTLADHRTADAAQRERLTRLSAHEMRTPLTIATSYVGLMLEQEVAPERRADLQVVADELMRLARAGDRVLRMIRLTDHLPRSEIDVDAVFRETVHRWSAVADRNWVVEAQAGTIRASIERVRVCLDTLIENALRYTTETDTVRLLAFRRGPDIWMGVADSGPGLSADQAVTINRSVNAPVPGPGSVAPDPHSLTGLGIGLVREIVEARHGRLLAGRAREGGALLVVRMPAGS